MAELEFKLHSQIPKEQLDEIFGINDEPVNEEFHVNNFIFVKKEHFDDVVAEKDNHIDCLKQELEESEKRKNFLEGELVLAKEKTNIEPIIKEWTKQKDAERQELLNNIEYYKEMIKEHIAREKEYTKTIKEIREANDVFFNDRAKLESKIKRLEETIKTLCDVLR